MKSISIKVKYHDTGKINDHYWVCDDSEVDRIVECWKAAVPEGGEIIDLSVNDTETRLVVTGTYNTRHGQRVIITGKDRNNLYHGHVLKEGSQKKKNGVKFWFANGVSYSLLRDDSKFDIIT